MTKLSDRSSGNVFDDLEVPDAALQLAKAELVRHIAETMAAGRLTQAVAAERMGLAQPDLSKILRGQFRPVSLEKLLLCLVRLGHPVTIEVGALSDTGTAKLAVA